MDEYRLFVHPHVEGRGLRLFQDPARALELEPAEVRLFRGGVVLLWYRSARR